MFQVTVALISFLETMLITYLSYKVRDQSTVHSFSPLFMLMSKVQHCLFVLVGWQPSMSGPSANAKTQGYKFCASNFRLRHHTLFCRNKLFKQADRVGGAVWISSISVISRYNSVLPSYALKGNNVSSHREQGSVEVWDSSAESLHVQYKKIPFTYSNVQYVNEVQV